MARLALRLLFVAGLPTVACGRSPLTPQARPCHIQTWAIPIAASEDDGEVSREYDPAGTWFPDGEPKGGSRMFVGAWGGQVCEVYYRFALPETLAADARVELATLALWGGDATWWRPNTTLVIGLEDTQDAATVVSATDTPADGNRKLLDLTVSWPATGGMSWPVDRLNVTPDLSALVQAALDRFSGLAQGQRIQFWLWASDALARSQAGTDDYATPQGHPALLHLSVCQ